MEIGPRVDELWSKNRPRDTPLGTTIKRCSNALYREQWCQTMLLAMLYQAMARVSHATFYSKSYTLSKNVSAPCQIG